MKKLYYLIVLTLILGLVLTGCLLTNVGQVPTTEQSGITYLTKGGPTVVTLFAGKDEDVGTVTVSDDGTNLTVIYNTTGGWEIVETHLHVAISLEGIPQARGNPIPGKFEYSMEHDPVVTEYTYTIPITWDLCTEELCIAAHAEVVKVTDELVANGGFELPEVVNPRGWDIFATGTSGLAWTVEPTSPPWDSGITEGLELQLISTPHSGNQYAELDAYDPVRIYQDLSTWPEGRCTLTYAWSPRPGVSENIMEVWWNGSKIAEHSADGSGGLDWKVESNGLVPNDSSQTCLEFIETGFDDQLGMFLDSVSVDCVQEETAWADGEDFPGKNWATYFNYTFKVRYSFTDSQDVNDGTVGQLVTTVEEDGEWMVWTFDFPVEEFTGDGNLNVGLIIALDGEGQGPSFQIHNNDGATLVEPHGTWMYGYWGPTINDGWFGWPNHDLDVSLAGLDWVEASGNRNVPHGDGVMEIRIKKSELGCAFHWAASPTVGTGFWSPAYDVTMQIPTGFDWSTPIVDMSIPNYIAR